MGEMNENAGSSKGSEAGVWDRILSQKLARSHFNATNLNRTLL